MTSVLNKVAAPAPVAPVSSYRAARTFAPPSVPLILFGLIAAIAQLPLLLPFLRAVRDKSQYGFAPLMVICATAFAWTGLRRWHARRQGDAGSLWIGGAFLGCAAGLLTAGTLIYFRAAAAYALVFSLAGFAWLWGGRALLQDVRDALLLLLTTVPPPFHLVDRITDTMRFVAVSWTSGLLDLLDVPHVQTRAVLSVVGRRLLVEDACGGINSAISLAAFTVLYGLIRRHRFRRIGMLIGAMCLWVLVANTSRLTLSTVLWTRFGVDAFAHDLHAFLGLVSFALACALVLSTDALLDRISSAIPDARPTGIARPFELNIRLWPALHHAPSANALTLFCLVGITVFAGVGVYGKWRLDGCWPASRVPTDVAWAVPSTVGDWRLESAETKSTKVTESIAPNRRRWVYRSTDGLAAEISLAYPFEGSAHTSLACYDLAGWQLNAMTRGRTAEGAEGRQFVEAHFSQPGKEMSVYFGCFDERGKWVRTPDQESTGGGFGLQARFAGLRHVATGYPGLEVQTLMVNGSALTTPQRAKQRLLFDAVSRSLHEQAVNLLGVSSTATKPGTFPNG